MLTYVVPHAGWKITIKDVPFVGLPAKLYELIEQLDFLSYIAFHNRFIIRHESKA